jgi:TP901 family phage tail tape measure protein
MATKDLIVNFFGKDELTKTFQKIASETESLNGKFGGLMKGAKALMAGLAGLEAIRIGKDIVSDAANFQSAMAMIRTQAGASQVEVDKMSKAVLGLAGPTATAPEQLAAGLYHLESAGLRGAKAQEALTAAAEGAKIGHADLESVTNALNAAVVSGIPGVENMQQAMGALNSVVGAGDMRMQDLAEAMGTGVLASVKGFGLSLNDVGAALATFGDNNIRGADAATELRMAVLFMAKPAATAGDTFKHLGMTTSQLASDMRSGGLIKAVQDLKTHLDNAGVKGTAVGKVLVDAFGHKAGTGMAVLVDQITRLKQKSDEVAKGASGFGDAWKATTETAAYKMQSLQAQFKAVSTQLGTVLLPVVVKVASWISRELPIGIELAKAAFARWKPFLTTVVDDLKATVAWVIQMKGWLIPLAAGVLAAAAAFKALTIIKSLIGVVQAFNAALRANAILAIVGLLIMLGAALVTAWKTSKSFRDTVTRVWTDVKHAFDIAIAKIVEGLRGLVKFFLDRAGDILHAAAHMMGWVPGIGPQLRQASTDFDTFEKNTLTAMQNFANNAEAAGRAAGSGFKQAFQAGLYGADDGHSNHEPGSGAGSIAIQYKQSADNASAAAANAFNAAQSQNQYLSGHGYTTTSKAPISAARRRAQREAADMKKLMDSLKLPGDVPPPGNDPRGGDSKNSTKAASTAAREHAAALKKLAQEAKQHAAALAAVAKLKVAEEKKAETAILASLRKQVDAFKAAAAAFRTSMRDAVQGGALDLAKLSQDADGGTSLTALNANLADRLAAVKKFAADLKALADAGASQDLIAQVAGMGPDQGDQLAAQLVSGGADAIKGVSDAMAQISAAAQSGADALTKQFYSPGASSMDQYIAGLQSKSPALKAALAAISKEVQATLGITTSSSTAATVSTYGGGAGSHLPPIHVYPIVQIDGKTIASSTLPHTQKLLQQAKNRTGSLT